MSSAYFAVIADWGVPVLALATFLSCLAVPVPTSLMMLAAGAFAASGDLSLASAALAAFAGAVLGDQAGFGLGRSGGQALSGWIARRPARALLMQRAGAGLARRGATAVFLSRWLFSPLGPYVNLLAGAARMNWGRFTLAGSAGEAVWVALYVGLGYAFGGQIAMIAELAANAVGLLTSAVLAAVFGLALWRRVYPAGTRV